MSGVPAEAPATGPDGCAASLAAEKVRVRTGHESPRQTELSELTLSLLKLFQQAGQVRRLDSCRRGHSRQDFPAWTPAQTDAVLDTTLACY